jgi:hypothetical protein
MGFDGYTLILVPAAQWGGFLNFLSVAASHKARPDVLVKNEIWNEVTGEVDSLKGVKHSEVICLDMFFADYNFAGK